MNDKESKEQIKRMAELLESACNGKSDEECDAYGKCVFCYATWLYEHGCRVEMPEPENLSV